MAGKAVQKIMDQVIGIDPGANGAIATISQCRKHIRLYPMGRMTERDIWLHLLGETLQDSRVYVERVGAMPGQGVVSMFTFGSNCGYLRGVLTALQLPWEYVIPQVWQRKIGLGGKIAEDKAARKRMHKQTAERLFPNVKMTLETADALLIAEYAWRINYQSR